MKRLLLLAVAVLLLAQVIPAQAHDPQFEVTDWGGLDYPYVLPTDPTVSFALYGYLEEHDIDAIALDFRNVGDKLQAQLLVTVCGKHYSDFYPQMAIVGPISSDFPTPADPKSLPFSLPKGMGAKIVEMDKPDANGKRPTMYEEIGETTFYTAPEVKMTVPIATRYYVVVWHKDGVSGDYAVATGFKETPYSPLQHTLNSIAFIRANQFLHRDCTKDPGDPGAIIQPDYRSVALPMSTAAATVSATDSATKAATSTAK